MYNMLPQLLSVFKIGSRQTHISERESNSDTQTYKYKKDETDKVYTHTPMLVCDESFVYDVHRR